jgi:hypothetical protein
MANEVRMAFNSGCVRRAANAFRAALAPPSIVCAHRPCRWQVLLAVPSVGLTVADAQLLFGHFEVTICLWLTRAGQHSEKVHAHFFRDLHLGHVQLDELP